MHQIVLFAKEANATMLWFRTLEKAKTEYQNIHETLKGTKEATVLTIGDDFGTLISAPIINVSHCILNDMSKQAELFRLMEGMGLAKKN